MEEFSKEHQQKLLSTAFTDFKSNPRANERWRDIGSFVQYFSEELTNDLKEELGGSHSQINEYAVAFDDWAAETSYSRVFDKDKVAQNLAILIEQLQQHEQGIDYTTKPLNKLFNGYLLKALSSSHDKALQLLDSADSVN